MGKKERERVLPSNAAQAVGKNLRVSPIKLNQVATSIRGMKAEKALAELTFSNKRISQTVKKVLESAIETLKTIMTWTWMLWWLPKRMWAKTW